MARSDYSYSLKQYEGMAFLAIVDLDLGRCSVTNDIENVVEEIYKREGDQIQDYLIVYEDSEGIWSGWDGDFLPVYGGSFQEAAVSYLDWLKRKKDANSGHKA